MSVILIHDSIDGAGAGNVRWLYRSCLADLGSLKRASEADQPITGLPLTFALARDAAGLAPFKLYTSTAGSNLIA